MPRSLLLLAALVLATLGALRAIDAWSGERVGSAVAASALAGDIRMLSSVTCVYCAEARAWFGDHGVPFSECYIERDAACAASYAALMAPGTPVLLVRGKVQRGFSPQAVAEALGPATTLQ
ncbi:MAG: glutaredoxin family protein [Caldimonas sp.]